jgi:hypothetical protein
MLYKRACVFRGLKERLGVLMNDVMFSYRSFFSMEVLGKRRDLITSCGASLSL